MKSRWDDAAAAQSIERWGGEFGPDVALRVYSARLIGSDSNLVLHGGGNVSVKTKHHNILGEEIDAIRVKGSGWNLATLEPTGLPALDLAYLRRLRTVDALDDDSMANEFRTHLFDASAPTPSIETLVHAFLPHKFVDHSHAGAVLVLTNQPDESLIREALGRNVLIFPYVKPGFDLAKAVADICKSHPDADAIVLFKHGLITFSDDARAAYERHIEIVDQCERFIADRAKGDKHPTVFSTSGSPSVLAGVVAPIMRGLLAVPSGNEDQPHRRSILEWIAREDVLEFVNSDRVSNLAEAAALTSDHVIRTKPHPLFIERPDWSDESKLRKQLSTAVDGFRDDYRKYVADCGGSTDGLDCSPRVVLLPGAGAFCWGETKRDARIAADITEHTLAAKLQADAIGAYAPLTLDEIFPMEFRTLQRSKLDRREPRPLESQVVMISGGAGAIGAAIAEACAAAGACVVIADLDAQRVEAVARDIESQFGAGTALGIVMDVTDDESVRGSFNDACRAYGGVDVVVPNAGIAHVSAIEDMKTEDFRRVLEINATGYLLFMREGARVLKRQGLGGHVIINASKNVFGPGRDFGAYSASKAAGHQLGKVAAIELAEHNIRVNMINADAVFSHKNIESGLWDEVGPQRAKSRGMKTEDLPEYYRKRNLLGARVYGHHVGNAVVFFASNATPTTGATLPVDGGVVDAFPR